MPTWIPKPKDMETDGGFDTFMRAIPAGDQDIQLPPGQYLTVGQPDGGSADTAKMWSLKSGWRLRGMGNTPKDVTICAVPPFKDGKKWHVIAADYFPVNDVRVENLSLDCGYQKNLAVVNYSGAVIRGSNNTVRGVRVVNWGSRLAKSECFGIGLVASGYDAHNNVVEDCDVSNPGGLDTVAGWSAILHSAISPAKSLNPVIRHCTVSNKDGGAGVYSNGFTIYNSKNGVIERCSASDLWSGVFLDDAGSEDLLVRDCQFDDVRRGVYIQFTRDGNRLGSTIVKGNRVTLIDPGSTAAACAFELNSYRNPDGAFSTEGFGLVELSDNRVIAKGVKSHLALVRGCKKLLIHDNVFFGQHDHISIGGRANETVCQWSNFYGDGAAINYAAEE